MLPFMASICSSINPLSAHTSIAGMAVIFGIMFFIRAARPHKCCGMRLHMAIHWYSKSCWVNSLFSSFGRALGSLASSVPGKTTIFDCRLCCFMLFHEKPIVPLSPFSTGRAAALYTAVGCFPRFTASLPPGAGAVVFPVGAVSRTIDAVSPGSAYATGVATCPAALLTCPAEATC